MALIDLQLTLKGRAKTEELLQSNVSIDDLSDINKLLLVWNRDFADDPTTDSRMERELLYRFNGREGLKKVVRQAETAGYLELGVNTTGVEDQEQAEQQSEFLEQVRYWDNQRRKMDAAKKEYALRKFERWNTAEELGITPEDVRHLEQQIKDLEAFKDDPEWE